MMHNLNLKIFFLSSVILLGACKGTDVLNDPIVQPKFELNKTNLELRVSENTTVSAKYFDEYGVEKIVPFSWNSTQPQNVTVDANGKIIALKAGNSQIYPKYQNIIGDGVNITVVASDNAVAKVTISAVKNILALNESINLSISAQNINNQTIAGTKTEWFSENESILKVDAAGKVTSTANGIAGIHAKIDGVKSNSIDFTVGTSNLMDTFTSSGGYKAVGAATLKNQNGQIILELGSDFETSFALGTFVYLANSTNGSIVRSNGLELGEIKSNGAKSFNVSRIKANVGINDYKYVIILCKPASVTFGFAELK
nr:DM13 domain-containing protein [Pseudopedobacter sp.]